MIKKEGKIPKVKIVYLDGSVEYAYKLNSKEIAFTKDIDIAASVNQITLNGIFKYTIEQIVFKMAESDILDFTFQWVKHPYSLNVFRNSNKDFLFSIWISNQVCDVAPCYLFRPSLNKIE